MQALDSAGSPPPTPQTSQQPETGAAHGHSALYGELSTASTFTEKRRRKPLRGELTLQGSVELRHGQPGAAQRRRLRRCTS